MLLGVVFYVIIGPALESFGSYICQWLEVQRSKLVVKLTENKKKVEDMEDDGTPQYNTNLIGFQTPSSSDYEDDEEEEEEDD